MENYKTKRNHFYSGIKDFWPDLYGEEYALYDISTIDLNEVEAIRLCTNRIGKIFYKVSELLRNVQQDTLRDLGYPEDTLDFIRLNPLNVESVIARLDLIKNENTYKCIEINSDTPTFIKELFSVNGTVANQLGYRNPNEGMEAQLGKAVRSAVAASAKWLDEIEPYVVFTAHEDNIEDRNTVLYLQDIYGLPSRFIALDKLRIVPDAGLFDEKGRRINILYRQTFPIESLIMDVDEKGNPIGKWLLELVNAKKLAIINPPSAFLLQNKAVQAVIWGLHEKNDPYFTSEEHHWIEDYFLPTYLEAEPFLKSQDPFVKKPIFGREGDTVEIYNSTGILLMEEKHKTYSDVLSIYQKYIELPSVSYKSEKGEQRGHVLTGSFLVNGKPSALGYRVGGIITNNLSCFLPVGLT